MAIRNDMSHNQTCVAHKIHIFTCVKGLFLPLVGVAFLSWEEPPYVFYPHGNIVDL